MTEQEIERCLERFAMGKACDVMNFDYAGTLAYLQRLKAENADLHERLKETEHRAEVAERALLHALEAAISNGECPECVIKFAGNCKGTVKDIRDCAALDVEDYLQQAEKELQGGKQ